MILALLKECPPNFTAKITKLATKVKYMFDVFTGKFVAKYQGPFVGPFGENSLLCLYFSFVRSSQKRMFPFTGMKIQESSKKCCFCCHFAQFVKGRWSILPWMTFEWPIHPFSSLFDCVITTYCSHLPVLKLELIQSKSALNQRCWALKTQDFRAKKISVFSFLTSADSEKVTADQVWKSSDHRWCFSCYSNQH